MKQKFIALTAYGIKPETLPNIAEQIRLVNGISFMGVPICLIYVIIFGVTGFYPLAFVFTIGIIIFTLPIFLNKWFGVITGRSFVNIFAPLIFASASVLSGRETGFYLGFLVIVVPPILIFQSLNKSILFVGYTVFIMLLSIYGNINFEPICKITWAMGIYLFNLYTVMFTTLTVVFIFKTELSKSRAKLEEKNKEITDSIKYAKRTQRLLLPPDKYIEKNIERMKKK